MRSAVDSRGVPEEDAVLLQKPFRLEDLVARMRQLLYESPG